MQPYKDINGDSGIDGYEIGADYIIVEFKQGREKFYKYTYARTGQQNVEHMKGLAVQGDGLNAFINTPAIKGSYESKW